MEKKHCKECKGDFYGRSDKKFCSDLCRNAFNNRLKNRENQVINQVNRILRKNRKILEEVSSAGNTTATREKLLTKGFNFSYFTNVYKTSKGREYFFCYDRGYVFTEGENMKVVLKKDYVE